MQTRAQTKRIIQARKEEAIRREIEWKEKCLKQQLLEEKRKKRLEKKEKKLQEIKNQPKVVTRSQKKEDFETWKEKKINLIEKTEKQLKKQPIYEVNIDFDDASACWRANKKHIGNGYFKYICSKVLPNGKTCERTRKIGFAYCACHSKGEHMDSDWLK
jgi:hypothetical protein